MKIDTNSIAHTTWNCKYHIVFAPKYRRQVIYRFKVSTVALISFERESNSTWERTSTTVSSLPSVIAESDAFTL